MCRQQFCDFFENEKRNHKKSFFRFKRQNMNCNAYGNGCKQKLKPQPFACRCENCDEHNRPHQRDGINFYPHRNGFIFSETADIIAKNFVVQQPVVQFFGTF